MYRSVPVLMRLLAHSSYGNPAHRSFAFSPTIFINSSNFSTDSNPQSPSPETSFSAETLVSSTSTHSSSSKSAASVAAEEEARSFRHETQSSRGERRGKVNDYQDEQSRLLQAALRHVVRLGWTEAAMISGAKEIGVSPSIIGSFPRKEAALIEFFMDDCLQRLIDRIDLEELRNLIPSTRISKLIQIRLEMQAPYISKWPQALSIQAQPANIPTSFKQRAMLVDEICHAVGDQGSDVNWYLKRTVLGGVYSTSEVYMLTDNSPEFRDTWAFLDQRVKDAFNLGKTAQEAKYFAETISEGMGNSLQGFMKRVFQS